MSIPKTTDGKLSAAGRSMDRAAKVRAEGKPGDARRLAKWARQLANLAEQEALELRDRADALARAATEMLGELDRP